MRPSTSKNSKGKISGCWTLSIVFLCLGALLATSFFVGIPLLAEHSFGKSSPELDPVQRSYLSLKLLLQENVLNTPQGMAEEGQSFEVQLGESTFGITRRLKAEGIISNDEALRNYLVYSGLDTSIQARNYIFNPYMTILEIALELQDSTPNEVVFRILPGWRLEEIAAALPTSGLNFSPDSFITRVKNPFPLSYLVLDLQPGASLEGYLFADSYRLPRQIDLDNFIHTLLENFETKVSKEIRESYESQGLSLHHAVILASIVQREAIVEEEMPMIASVFLNRLSNDMKLDSDPTVQYALGYDPIEGSWWKSPLSMDDLKIDSPYNTYINSGFPPGPISNPSLSALKSVAYPAQTTYFYFRATCDGSGLHNFSQTYEEHQQNACP